MNKIVAEIGCNHKGDMDIARKMITTAKIFCGADYVKFQKRTNRELLTDEEYHAPHPSPANSYGNTYGEHREYLEFTSDQHRELKDFCEQSGIGYSTSVWDISAAKAIVPLEPDFIKIPSACNLNNDLMAFLADEYSGDIHVSVGMTSRKEEDTMMNFFEKKGVSKRVVIYSCTSGYPVPFKDVCLLEIKRLKEKFSGKIKAVGFSGHHLGIAIDTVAWSLGAEWIERHFTLDRTWKGTDHAASLEPEGLRKLKRNIDAVEEAFTYKSQEILGIEQIQRDKLKRK